MYTTTTWPSGFGSKLKLQLIPRVSGPDSQL